MAEMCKLNEMAGHNIIMIEGQQGKVQVDAAENTEI